MTTPIRSSTAEMLLCLKRDSSYDLENPLTYESEEDNSDQQQLPTVNIENMSEESICNCKKSRCLKLYCQCFAGRVACNPTCKCVNCANTPAHESERDEAVRVILERNPAAFDSKFKREGYDDGVKTSHKTGCRCRKSMCLKKYCECFNAGVLCSTICTCLQCSNTGPPNSHVTSLGLSPSACGGPELLNRAQPLYNSPGEEAMIRAAQDLALLKNKDTLLPDVATKNTMLRLSPETRMSPSCTVSSTTFEKLGAEERPVNGRVSANSVNDAVNSRKRSRSESPVHDFSAAVGGGPPSILTRSGNGKRTSPPLSAAVKLLPKTSAPSNSKCSTNNSSRESIFYDFNKASSNAVSLNGVVGAQFKRQAPAKIRITSASPNSLCCASALSLLSGHDMSPQSLGSISSNVFSTASKGNTSNSFFVMSPVPYSTSSLPNRHGETTDDEMLAMKRGDCRDSSAVDSQLHVGTCTCISSKISATCSLSNTLTCERSEMVTTTCGNDTISCEEGGLMDQSLPTCSSGGFPKCSVPTSSSERIIDPGLDLDSSVKSSMETKWNSRIHDDSPVFSTLASPATVTQLYSNSKESPDLSLQDTAFLNEGNWAKPVVNVMSKLS